ncbi:MAG: amino acid transporter [Gallionellales bacterium 35-53-114]|jgi:multiple antibiotic resistance protein|nr:MAG: amino acid transporter [Gallionellales bacterium 35-53-114]OYZ63754.1 MAG: amino acid transporter [Gallionellales bacterium 24-53-125]OZB09413.1 MAG: amino acid transporter [Gallionellales bacterium 39-52-133]HQS57930.1 NAAT family transporter [Gallionellaceae bacterium]HQS76091.1 NAAT family transporter [Gallionellaceae bacterium]
MLEFTEYTKIFISLFAILDPIGIIPVIILFTAGMTASQRNRNGRIASLAVFLILLAALLIGESLLAFFGISIHSLGLAGGILLMVMAFKMLNGNVHQLTPETSGLSADDSRSVLAIVPLSTPLLAGPGSISTVILNAHKATEITHYLSMSLIIALLSLSVWLTFLAAPWVERRMGTLGIDIFTRLMGLILAAIAVEFVASGMRGLFPALG